MQDTNDAGHEDVCHAGHNDSCHVRCRTQMMQDMNHAGRQTKHIYSAHETLLNHLNVPRDGHSRFLALSLFHSDS